MLTSLATLVLFQESVSPTGADIHWIVIELGVIALFFLLIMIVAAIVGVKALAEVKKVQAKIDSLEKRGETLLAEARIKGDELLTEARAKVVPFVDKAQAIMEDLQPKIKSVTDDMQHISRVAREKVDEIGTTVTQVNGTVQDVNIKTRQQAERVNGIVSSALTTTHEVSDKIQAGIRYPINQIAGWVAGLKAGLETLAKRSPFAQKRPTSPYDL